MDASCISYLLYFQIIIDFSWYLCYTYYSRMVLEMRLLICDSFRISTFVLPTKVEDYFTINYYYSSGSFSTIETLNLEAKNGVWNLLTNESLIIKLGDVFLKEVVLKEYSIYKINFSDIKENIYIYVLGDSVNY